MIGPFTAVAIYLIIWWTTLFAILPLGVRSHAEEGLDPGDGGDPAAPVDPKLKRKFLTTTWISAVIWLVAMVLIWTRVVPLPSLPSGS